jgi:GrpB-like predicted nucleotidyltransferase (UPF0157 family)
MDDPQAMNVLGLAAGTVRVVPYDAGWPALFEREAERIRAALDGLPLRLEHVGSTSVPGLPAKPIVDIMAGYPPGSAMEPYVAALVRAGYVHRGERGIPGREFFRRGDPRSYHLHMVALDSPLWREHVGFRDHLRAHPETAAEYAALKHALAERHPRDREAYIDGKADFITSVLRRAGLPTRR